MINNFIGHIKGDLRSPRQESPSSLVDEWGKVQLIRVRISKNTTICTVMSYVLGVRLSKSLRWIPSLLGVSEIQLREFIRLSRFLLVPIPRFPLNPLLDTYFIFIVILPSLIFFVD